MTIKLENLNKSYGKKPVLFDINLEIPTGSFTMLKGVSGSGKSTLLSIIGGIEPMTSGQVMIDNQDVSKLKGKARADFYRHKIGFIFQGFYLQPQLTISENIALMGIFAGMPKKEREARAKELAEKLGISEVLGNLPAEVSGGQAERACAARAMFMHPEIILADEPTNNLDPENAKNVIEMLKQIQQETGATMIVASHDPLVEKYATQIVNIREGRVNTTSADESKDAQEGE
jgi:ABC-type lipoprotein export system ATPase subunit